MSKNTNRIVSLALAGTIISGGAVSASADNWNDGVVKQEVTTSVEYVVKEGDTLGKIAKCFFGNEGYYDLLAAYNNIEDANDIYPGEVIIVPNDLFELLNCEYSTDTYLEDKTYIVNDGDTLYCIVNAQYGLKNQEAVDKLATYNNLSDPNRLYVGQVLYIPAVDKLQAVVANDYTDEYNRMGWILNHQDEKKCPEPKLFCYPPVFVKENPWAPCMPHPDAIPPVKGPCHRRVLKP